MGRGDGEAQRRRTRVVLAGNPNSGKTTIFNELTGARHKVANYPGVTVEKREGTYYHRGQPFEVLDLPGTYSLTSYSAEERIARDEMVRDGVSVTVVVVEAAQLSRSLHLLAQVMQLQANPILCLNMWDEFERGGATIDIDALQQRLGIPVVTTIGRLGAGIDRLREVIAEAAQSPFRCELRPTLGERLEQALAAVSDLVERAMNGSRGRWWTAEKLLLGDPAYVGPMQALGPRGAEAVQAAAEWRRTLETEAGPDICLLVPRRYHGSVERVLREAQHPPPRAHARAWSDRIDRVLADRILGLPICFATMYRLFWVTFRLGEIPMAWLGTGFASLGSFILAHWPGRADSALASLVVDGIVGGVGGVLVFLPNIILLFWGLALLEDTGYMARAAYLMDRFLHRFGLHGQSFIPLVTGFGCSIPGIMATRTLRNEHDRLTTIFVLPLMSCGARLPIWMLLVPAFFPLAWRAPVLWSIYLTGIILALLLAWLLRRRVLRGEASPFLLELPPYRIPTLKSVGLQIFDRASLYLRKAGTVILAISILLWAASTYPKPASYDVDAAIAAGELSVVEEGLMPGARTDVREGSSAVLSAAELEARRGAEALRASVAGRLGAALEPLLKPMGLDWRLGAGLVGAFAAKEVFVAQMGVVYALGAADAGSEGLRAALHAAYPRSAGLALILFLLVATPCMATVAVTRRETGGWTWALLQFWGLTALGYLLGVAVHQAARLW